MPHWKIRFDVPYKFQVESGFSLVKHATDFRKNPLAFGTGGDLDTSPIYRDPLTGLLMLTPSFLTREYGDDFRELTFWRHQTQFWLDTKRGVFVSDSSTVPALLSSVRPSDLPAGDVEIIMGQGLVTIKDDDAKKDTLKWVLESKFLLNQDEGFVLHYHGLTDELVRKENWFAIAWDNVYLHFSQTGKVRVFGYPNRGDMVVTPPELIDEFIIANPGDLMYRVGYFIILPIPGRGLAIYWSSGPQELGLKVSNAFAGVTRGHLIPWPTRTAPGGYNTLFESSPVRIAINPYMGHVMGFQHISYPDTGTFVDGVIELPHVPTLAPDFVDAPVLPTGHGSATAELVNPKDTGTAFVVGTDRQARVKITLSSGGPFLSGPAHYTPFVENYGVKWSPIFVVRDTTIVEPDKLLHLEITEDEYARMEGTATVLMQSAAAVAVMMRGDATWQIEKSEDGEIWTVVGGGIAGFKDIETHETQHGTHYTATATLHDLWGRFREVHQTVSDAVDGLRGGDALNRVISTAFPPIADDEIPAEVQAFRLPITSGQNFRFASRMGDDGAKLITSILLMLRKQNTEWRLRWSWAGEKFVIEKKPRDTGDTNHWQLRAKSSERDLPNRKVRYMALSHEIDPPEGNVIQPVGLSDPNAKDAKRIMGAPVKNDASISDKTSVDYLGRVRVVMPILAPLSDESELNKMARRVYDAVAHRQHKMKVHLQDYTDALKPLSFATVYNAAGAVVGSGWVKRRTIVIDQDDKEQVLLELDSIWEGELKET